MVRILLLDCSDALRQSLVDQGFDVESGTAGMCTGVKKLPSQVYEKDIFVYDPTSCMVDKEIVTKDKVTDASPQYSFDHLKARIDAGGTFMTFVNHVSATPIVETRLYDWIPYMPSIQPTSDQLVSANAFSGYPDYQQEVLAPIVTKHELALPVLHKIVPPQPQDYPRDIFPLFWNGNGDFLGVLILRRSGRLIVLPRFKSNDAIVETFLHRVVPRIYNTTLRTGLVDLYVSPLQQVNTDELKKLDSMAQDIKKRQDAQRIQLADAQRAKANVINADTTAKQILIYHDEARKQPDVALFYLYKIVESIENKFGGETRAIAAVGASTEWKSVKRLANESYRDARHAPKPSDKIKQWTEAEIKKCSEETIKIVMAYFDTLFKSNP